MVHLSHHFFFLGSGLPSETHTTFLHDIYNLLGKRKQTGNSIQRSITVTVKITRVQKRDGSRWMQVQEDGLSWKWGWWARAEETGRTGKEPIKKKESPGEIAGGRRESNLLQTGRMRLEMYVAQWRFALRWIRHKPETRKRKPSDVGWQLYITVELPSLSHILLHFDPPAWAWERRATENQRINATQLYKPTVRTENRNPAFSPRSALFPQGRPGRLYSAAF